MNHIKHSLKPFFDILFGDPARTQFERAEKQARISARIEAEAEYHRRMANFYTDRVLSLDPNTQWWEFAEAKQKQYDHQCECLRYERRASGNTDYTDIPELAKQVRQPQGAVSAGWCPARDLQPIE